MSKKHDIIWLDTVKSTNEYARMHIENLDNLSVIAAYEQTCGKGQGDHLWHSKPGENITASIILKNPDIRPAKQKIISDLTATSIVQFLDYHGIKAWIKPPNDIWVDNKKICGILIEHSLRGNHISWTVIGIGLNVNQISFPDELPNPTSMAIEKKGGNVEALLSELLEIFISHASALSPKQDLQL